MKAIPARGVVTSLFSFLFVIALTTTQSLGQTATLSGTITDADDGQPLIGASVVLFPDGQATMAGGSATDLDGRYSVQNLLAGTYTVRVTFVGYNEITQSITLNSGESRVLDFELSQGGFDLNTVVVTASRRQEKALDAPASISVLDAEDLQTDVSMSSAAVLRNTTGVDMAQTGVDRREIVLRGFNNAFSGATYVLTDYRQAAAASLGVNLYSIMPNMSIDIDRVEVVRGPGSALYGAGVDAGVIHFLTKDPFTHPGTTVSVMGGERSMLGIEARHAGVLNENVGYKITGAYAQADDWNLNPSDPLDEAQLQSDHVYTDPATAPENQKLDESGRIVRNYDYQKLNLNGTLEYRVGETAVTGTVGYSRYSATVLSGIGTLQADGFGYSYAQVRLQNGNFFAQAYLNHNAAGDSFVYGSGDVVVDNSNQINGQAQYNVDLAGGRHNLVFGADLDVTMPETKGTILGRNENDDQITELGSYLQGTFALSDKLDMTAAIRGDYNNVVEAFQLSPRAAFVFKPTPSSSVRASYNRAFSSPGINSLFLDIVAANLPGGITLRGLGSAKGWHWNRNTEANWESTYGSDLVATSLNPATLGVAQPVGLPLDNVYSSVYASLSAIPPAQLVAILGQAGITVDEPTASGLIALLSPVATQVTGFSRGELALLNTTTGSFDPLGSNTAVDIDPLKQTTTNTVELGFNGIMNNRVLFAIDGYYTQKSDFVGPLRMESPFVLVPDLSTDLLAALTAGISSNTVLAGQLSLLGQQPSTVAGLIVQLASGSLPDAQTPVAIVEAEENAVGVGNVPEAFLSYRNFGKVGYLGADISVQFLATDEISLFANASLVSDDFFDASELGEADDSGLNVALNAPRAKLKLGGQYLKRNSFSAGISARYTDGFPIRSGPYVGDLPSYFLVDLSAGYDFGAIARGLRLDATVQNILDERHREFIGAPEIGRMGMVRLTVTI
ncbi:MAG: TonB-dependent receptor [Rhodothermales bacterium]